MCVPTDITGCLHAGPTLWELRFKAWHKIDVQNTHKQQQQQKRIVSRLQLNKKLPWRHLLDHRGCHHSKGEVGKGGGGLAHAITPEILELHGITKVARRPPCSSAQ